MNKRSLTIVTIALFAIGIGSGLFILYDYLNESATSPKLIGKEAALAISMETGRWDKSLLSDKTIDTKLLHIKNDGFAFSVDEKTLKDSTLFPNRFNDLKDGQYVWLVKIAMVGGSNKEWGYTIDASDGSVLNSRQNTDVLEPANPQVSVREGTVISQAKGNVTIVFPKGISSQELKQTPFPAQLIITQGDTVTWRNDDTVAHTVTSGYWQQEEFAGRMFDSGIIASGKSFSNTFSDERIDGYRYFCSIHPWMTGEVLVQHPESESSADVILPKLLPVKSLRASYDEFVGLLMGIKGDSIIEKQESESKITFITNMGSIEINKGLKSPAATYIINKNPINMTDIDVIEYSKSILDDIGYTQDGTESITSIGSPWDSTITFTQLVNGEYQNSHHTTFYFSSTHTKIELGRWYENISKIKFLVSNEDAKKIAYQYMQSEIERNSELQKRNMKAQMPTFESLQIVDDRIAYYLDAAVGPNNHPEVDSPNYVGVLVDVMTGQVLDWDYAKLEI